MTKWWPGARAPHFGVAATPDRGTLTEAGSGLDEFQDLLTQVRSVAADAADQAAAGPKLARQALSSEFHGLVGNLRQIRRDASAVLESEPSATMNPAAAWLADNKDELDKFESDSRDAEQSPDGVLNAQLPQLVQRAHELADSYRAAIGE